MARADYEKTLRIALREMCSKGVSGSDFEKVVEIYLDAYDKRTIGTARA